MDKQPSPILKFEGVYHRYPSKETLKDVSLAVYPQEVVVILGPSGSGKSTLLKCVNGLEKPSAGAITYRAVTTNELINNAVADGAGSQQEVVLTHPKTDWRLYRQRIGMVFQHYDLFPHLTIEANLMLAPLKVLRRDKTSVRQEALALLERVGLLDYAKSYPSQLSGGQKQRVAIARALCMQPEIMLFDEVTASLDPELVREVLDVIRELTATGMTLIIVTHELEFARAIADRIVFMDDGRIVEIATPNEFFTAPQSQRARQFLKLA